MCSKHFHTVSSKFLQSLDSLTQFRRISDGEVRKCLPGGSLGGVELCFIPRKYQHLGLAAPGQAFPYFSIKEIFKMEIDHLNFEEILMKQYGNACYTFSA